MNIKISFNDRAVVETTFDHIGWTNKILNTEFTYSKSDEFYWCEMKDKVTTYDTEIRKSTTFHLLWRKLSVDRTYKIRECD